MPDFIINTHDNVYIPAEDSYLLAENLEIKPDQSVLEIGTGSGIVAMYASRLSNNITVTDINFDANLHERILRTTALKALRFSSATYSNLSKTESLM